MAPSRTVPSALPARTLLRAMRRPKRRGTGVAASLHAELAEHPQQVRLRPVGHEVAVHPHLVAERGLGQAAVGDDGAEKVQRDLRVEDALGIDQPAADRVAPPRQGEVIQLEVALPRHARAGNTESPPLPSDGGAYSAPLPDI